MSPRYDTAPERFGHLIRALHEQAGQRVAVLIDEYDKPILDALEVPEVARANHDYLRGLSRGVGFTREGYPESSRAAGKPPSTVESARHPEQAISRASWSAFSAARRSMRCWRAPDRSYSPFVAHRRSYASVPQRCRARALILDEPLELLEDATEGARSGGESPLVKAWHGARLPERARAARTTGVHWERRGRGRQVTWAGQAAGSAAAPASA